MAELLRGDRAAARRAADQASSFLERAPPIHSGLIVPQSFVAEVYLDLAEKAPSGEERTLSAALGRSLATLERSARVFPIAEPALLRCRGRAAALAGHRRKADRMLSQGLAAARRFEMAHEEALMTRLLAGLAEAPRVPRVEAG